MEIYFDNAATTPCTQAVKEAVVGAMMTDYGNPSSAHMKGVEAERLLKGAREKIAGTLRCSEKEIYFTSGASESNNWAILGGAAANRRAGMHLITTAVEHASVLMPMKHLEEQGYRVTYLPVDRYGRINPEDLKKALDQDTILVSIMFVNNELGTIQPVEECGRIIKEYSERILFHVDAVQAYGKLPVQPAKLHADLLSASAHKIHGPKGAGFLYVKEKTRLQPLILGGGQQKGMRSGTDNVSGAAGFAAAAEECVRGMDENAQYLTQLRDQLAGALAKMEHVTLHTPVGEGAAPHILNASFTGVRSEVLLHALEEEGIYVSAGSACTTNKKLPVSPVLQQLQIPREEQESALRFSFSRFNTPEEVEITCEALKKLVPMLRRYSRR